MQEEMNNLYKDIVAPIITFRGDMKSSGQSDYFPASDDKNKYTYYLRWQDLSGGEPVEQVKNLGTISSVPFITSTVPSLLPATIYSCQLIRKTERIFTVTLPDGQTVQLPQSEMNLQIIGRDITSLQASQDGTLNMQDTLSAEIQLDPGQVAGPGEDIIYQFYFRTSKYSTLADKIANVSTSFENIETDLTHYPKVIFSMDERFDEFDVLGYYDTESPFQRLIAPRVHIGAILNSNPVYTFSHSPPEIYTQPTYLLSGLVGVIEETLPGQPSYNNYLNHSLIGFVNLYTELSSQSHTVQAQRISGTRPTPLPLTNRFLPTLNTTISQDYTQNEISFSFGDQEIEGYQGPMTDQFIQNAWTNSETSGPQGGSLGSGTVWGGNIALNLNNSSFSVTYKMPYWVYLDINKAIGTGDQVLAMTTTTGSVNIPPLGGGTSGGIIGGNGPETEVGTGTTRQTMGSGGPNEDYYSPSGYYSFQTLDHHSYNNTGDLTTYNVWSHYLDTYYPAYRIQLDNMGLNHKKMQNHNGSYKMVIRPDRGWLPTDLPSEDGKGTLSFNYNPFFGSGLSGSHGSQGGGIVIDGGTMGTGSGNNNNQGGGSVIPFDEDLQIGTYTAGGLLSGSSGGSGSGGSSGGGSGPSSGGSGPSGGGGISGPPPNIQSTGSGPLIILGP